MNNLSIRTPEESKGIQPFEGVKPAENSTRYVTFFNRTEKFHPLIHQDNALKKRRCIELIELGKYSEASSIAKEVPCCFILHSIINRLIHKGAYEEAADVASICPSEMLRESTIYELASRQAYLPALRLNETIMHEPTRKEIEFFIQIDQGSSAETLREEILKIPESFVKYNLVISLLNKSSIEDLSKTFSVVKEVLRSLQDEFSDEMKRNISYLLLKKGAIEQAHYIANKIKDSEQRFVLTLLASIEKKNSVSYYFGYFSRISNSSIREICLALIRNDFYEEAAQAARFFREEVNRGGDVIDPEWNRCDIFLELIDRNAYEAAITLLPFFDRENRVLVHEALLRKQEACEEASNGPIEKLKVIAEKFQRLKNLGDNITLIIDREFNARERRILMALQGVE